MKLATLAILTLFTVGAAAANADHNHHQHWKAGHKQHKHQGRHQRSHRDGHHYGEVVEVEPIYRYYRTASTESCRGYEHRVQPYRGYTSTVFGAVVGGALGHRIGDAHGDPAAAAIAGGLLGAAVGNEFDTRLARNSRLRVDGPCRSSGHDRQRREIVEYRVRYRYNGEIYLARMDRHPGNWVKLDVDVKPA